MGGRPVSNVTKPAVYVVDTHALVWFLRGEVHKMGLSALFCMLHPRLRLIVPSYALEEVHRKFGPTMQAGEILVPPSALLRLLLKCSNVRILNRGAAVLAREFQLKRQQRTNRIPDQDIPIAASVLAVQQHYEGKTVLLSGDSALKSWGVLNGITVIWNQRPVEGLPM